MSEVTLSPEQQKIVDLESGQHLVLAPPGTGKTELLVHRIIKALDSDIPQEKIACLTFTNRAAKNMVDRIEKAIGENDIFIGNIHRFCSKFLRKNDVIPQITSMLDEEDQILLLTEIRFDAAKNPHYSYARSLEKYKNEDILAYNSRLKQISLGFDLELCQKNPFLGIENERETSLILKLICANYEAIKKESDFIDFDDLLNLTYNHLKHNASDEIPIKWLQVDEAQDLNPLQWAIINEISSKESSHRVFFGDAEQAIFSFMGASLENLKIIRNGCEEHYLKLNYRSPQYLLDLYNLYATKILDVDWSEPPQAANNTQKPTGALCINFYKTKYIIVSMDEEARDIVYRQFPLNQGEKAAILVRYNATADLYWRLFHDSHPELRVYKVSGFDLFRRVIVKDLIKVLTVIVKDRDKSAWSRNMGVFGGTTFKAARPIVNKLFNCGFNPLDFLKSQTYLISFLDDFLDLYNSERIVVFDTETTGLNIDRDDDIIQIAAVELIGGKIGHSFEVFIDTDLDFTEADKIHHISKEHLQQNATDKNQALSDFINFVNGDALVAHNLKFDCDILNNNLSRVGLPLISSEIKTYDSVDIVKRLYPRLYRYKLGYLINLFELEGENTHNALDDVKATINLITHCTHKITETKLSRLEWLENPDLTRVINKFSDRFSPLYEALASDFNKEVSMSDITHSITSYINDHIKAPNKKYGEDDFNELAKLKYYMDKTCVLDKSIKSMQKHIPELEKAKEVDLIIEDETDVVISTIYKAKGLEWDTVFIPFCIEEVFPRFTSKTRAQIQEDARLLYVAMTRAKKKIVISYPYHVNTRGKRAGLSRFLNSPIRDMFENYKIEL